ncbi:MAG: membrane lipoprotein lipid attachment site-containing protein [Verrucomicrobia bacterium]|nr:membrane lipoprotein lipid attachment site-containing protein [Verrucomicrobiota bacterium]
MRKYLALFLGATLLLAGCQAGRELPGLGSEAVTRSGQLRYATRARSFIGDFILRYRPGGDYDLAFSKSGVPLLQLQVHGDRLSATGSFARGGWTGSAAHAPGALRTWAELHDVIPYFNSSQTAASRGKLWRANFVRQGSRLNSAQIQFAHGESLFFNFAQSP